MTSLEDVAYFNFKVENVLAIKPEKIRMWPFVNTKTIGNYLDKIELTKKQLQQIIDDSIWRACYFGRE